MQHRLRARRYRDAELTDLRGDGQLKREERTAADLGRAERSKVGNRRIAIEVQDHGRDAIAFAPTHIRKQPAPITESCVEITRGEAARHWGLHDRQKSRLAHVGSVLARQLHGQQAGDVSRATPRELVDAECSRRGRAAFVEGCRRLVAGDYADASLIVALAPQSSAKYFDGKPHDDEYWFRVWGMRGLLWAYDDSAADAVIAGAADEAWRVREMAARVAARHLVGDAMDVMAGLRDDPVPRVRAAAARAVRVLSEAGA